MTETGDVRRMREVIAPGITEVRVDYGRTVNLGNFEAERLAVGLTATLGADDDALTVAHTLVEDARQAVAFHLERLERERREDERR